MSKTVGFDNIEGYTINLEKPSEKYDTVNAFVNIERPATEYAEAGVEKVYLGEVHREGSKWVSHHLPYDRPPSKTRREVLSALLASVQTQTRCKRCQSFDITGIEYPARYDGVSEWRCNTCGVVWDRWTGEIVEVKQ